MLLVDLLRNCKGLVLGHLERVFYWMYSWVTLIDITTFFFYLRLTIRMFGLLWGL